MLPKASRRRRGTAPSIESTGNASYDRSDVAGHRLVISNPRPNPGCRAPGWNASSTSRPTLANHYVSIAYSKLTYAILSSSEDLPT